MPEHAYTLSEIRATIAPIAHAYGVEALALFGANRFIGPQFPELH